MLSGTVVNPTKKLVDYLGENVANRLTKALLVVGTPQHSRQLQDLSAEFPKLQTVALAVDSVPCGVQHNGFSWLVFDKLMSIKERIEPKPSEARQWQMPSAAIHVKAGQLTLTVPAAPTLFENGLEASIFAGSPSTLERLHVELPIALKVRSVRRPLRPISKLLTVTSVADNMLKSLDDCSPASFLENVSDLMETAARDRRVFAELQSGGNTRYYEVVAGGGGLWSAKARMLVLETDARPRVGDKIRFHLSVDTFSGAQLQAMRGAYREFENRESCVLEVGPVSEHDSPQQYFEAGPDGFFPGFGFGSERGFLVNGTRHAIVGEVVELVEV